MNTIETASEDLKFRKCMLAGIEALADPKTILEGIAKMNREYRFREFVRDVENSSEHKVLAEERKRADRAFMKRLFERTQ